MSKYKITLNGKAYEIEVEEMSESEAKAATKAVVEGAEKGDLRLFAGGHTDPAL